MRRREHLIALHAPQPLVFVGYIALVLAFLFRFRRMILSTEYMLLILAMLFLAVSAFVDLFVTAEEFYIAEGIQGRHLIEDGLKLLGIVTWAVYFFGIFAQQIRACSRPT